MQKQSLNYLLFFALSAAVLAGWYWLAGPTNTPKPKIDPNKEIAKVKPEPEKKKETKPDEKVVKKEEVKPPPKNVAPPKEKVEPATSETLGGSGYHLTVVTTSLGAGVRKVTLNRFETANWQGRPTSPQRPLELIQDDEITPSFIMYHYVNAKDAIPVFGLGEKIWKFEGRNKPDEKIQEVRYSATVPELEHIKITKTYRLAPTDYHVTLLLEVEDTRDPNDKATNQDLFQFRYQLTGGHGLPIEGEWYATTFRNSLIGIVDGRGALWRKLEDSGRISHGRGGSKFPEDLADNRFQYAGVANQFFASMIVVDDKQPERDQGGKTWDKILEWARPTQESMEKRGVIKKIDHDDNSLWFRDEKREERKYRLLPRFTQHLKDLDVGVDQKVILSFYETPNGERVATWLRLGETLKAQFDDITMRVMSKPIELTPSVKVAHQFLLYHGPVKAALLAQFSGDSEVPEDTVTRYTDTLHLRTLTDYPSDNFFGSISSFIHLTDLIILVTRFMHWLFYKLHFVFGYGLAIVVLTVMVRGCMFPISRRQALFSIKMQELAPEMKKITEKYKDDMMAQQQARSELMKKHGVSTWSSCWPVLLQMPIFLGLYFALQESIHFRLSEFLWIENLAAPDMLKGWTEHIPAISTPDPPLPILSFLYLGPYFNVLPIVAVALMMVQQMQTMPPPTDDQQAAQQKMMKYMTIVFGVMFYKVAAGLCIYFIASSLWGCAERMLLPKKKKAADAAAAATGIVPPPQTPQNAKWKSKVSKVEKPVEANGKLAKMLAWWAEVRRQAEKK